jgi:hypothetical protein
LGLEDDNGDREGNWRVLRGFLGITVQRKFLGVVVAGV